MTKNFFTRRKGYVDFQKKRLFCLLPEPQITQLSAKLASLIRLERRNKARKSVADGPRFKTTSETHASLSKLLLQQGFFTESRFQKDHRSPYYWLDFAHLRYRINVELDGRSHLSSWRRDALRDKQLHSENWVVFRVSGYEEFRNGKITRDGAVLTDQLTDLDQLLAFLAVEVEAAKCRVL